MEGRAARPLTFTRRTVPGGSDLILPLRPVAGPQISGGMPIAVISEVPSAQ